MVLFWAVKSGQFDDMDSPAHKILFDDDEPLIKKTPSQGQAKDNKNGLNND